MKELDNVESPCGLNDETSISYQGLKIGIPGTNNEKRIGGFRRRVLIVSHLQ